MVAVYVRSGQQASGESVLPSARRSRWVLATSSVCSRRMPADPGLLAGERAFERLALWGNSTGRGRCGKAFHSSAERVTRCRIHTRTGGEGLADLV